MYLSKLLPFFLRKLLHNVGISTLFLMTLTSPSFSSVTLTAGELPRSCKHPVLLRDLNLWRNVAPNGMFKLFSLQAIHRIVNNIQLQQYFLCAYHFLSAGFSYIETEMYKFKTWSPQRAWGKRGVQWMQVSPAWETFSQPEGPGWERKSQDWEVSSNQREIDVWYRVVTWADQQHCIKSLQGEKDK